MIVNINIVSDIFITFFWKKEKRIFYSFYAHFCDRLSSIAFRY